MPHETPLSIASDAHNACLANQIIRHEAVMERGWGRGQKTDYNSSQL
jgi:hypothetical protein